MTFPGFLLLVSGFVFSALQLFRTTNQVFFLQFLALDAGKVVDGCSLAQLTAKRRLLLDLLNFLDFFFNRLLRDCVVARVSEELVFKLLVFDSLIQEFYQTLVHASCLHEAQLIALQVFYTSMAELEW